MFLAGRQLSSMWWSRRLPCPRFKETYASSCRWVNGVKKINLLLSCLPGIDTHHFCSHSAFISLMETSQPYGPTQMQEELRNVLLVGNCFPARALCCERVTGVFTGRCAIFATRTSPLFPFSSLTRGLWVVEAFTEGLWIIKRFNHHLRQ